MMYLNTPGEDQPIGTRIPAGINQRRTEFEGGKQEKLVYDAKNLKEKADRLSKEKGRPVTVEQLILREADKTQARVAEIMRQVLLNSIKSDYDRVASEYPRFLRGLTWEELEKRLSANNDLQLSRVNGLDKPVFFGVDENGKALFATGKRSYEMTGMNYNDSRNAVMYKQDPTTGEKIPTGYELFNPEYVKMYQKTTGRNIVELGDMWDVASIWLESGEKPKVANLAELSQYITYAKRKIHKDADPNHGSLDRGVRRMLRV